MKRFIIQRMQDGKWVDFEPVGDPLKNFPSAERTLMEIMKQYPDYDYRIISRQTTELAVKEYIRMQECGHPVSAIVSSDEGTHYCKICAKIAAENAN